MNNNEKKIEEENLLEEEKKIDINEIIPPNEELYDADEVLETKIFRDEKVNQKKTI